MGTRVKYPRTPHLPWSPGATPGDERVANVSAFVEKMVVVTEKMDGECTTIDARGCHARSLDTARHASRDWVRALAGRVGREISEVHPDLCVIGENLYAEHSIRYAELPSYFLAFATRVGDEFLSWDLTVDIAVRLGLETAPVLYHGPWDEVAVRACHTGRSRCGGEQEGYVVRVADGFGTPDFGRSVAKYVRAGHMQTDEHWLSRPVVANGLRKT